MKTCTKCFEERPDRDFVTYNKPHDECKKCIARERARLGMQNLRDRTKYINKLQVVQRRLTDRQATLDATYLRKRLEHVFNQAVSVTKQRIKIMERNLAPPPKTQKAIAVRKALLGKYEQAYAEQRAMLEAGIEPPNIHDIVVSQRTE